MPDEIGNRLAFSASARQLTECSRVERGQRCIDVRSNPSAILRQDVREKQPCLEWNKTALRQYAGDAEL